MHYQLGILGVFNVSVLEDIVFYYQFDPVKVDVISTSSSDEGGLSTGAAVAIAVCVSIAGIVLIVILVLYILKHRRDPNRLS